MNSQMIGFCSNCNQQFCQECTDKSVPKPKTGKTSVRSGVKTNTKMQRRE